MIGAIVLAGGQGKRMNAGINKQYLRIDGRTVLSYAVESMAQVASALIVVAAAGETETARRAIAESGVDAARCQIVEGGAERQDSVRKGLEAMPATWRKVLIHDGARPFVPRATLIRVLGATKDGVGAVPGVAVTDTMKRVDADGFIVETPSRATLRAAQTPQCFMAAEIRALHQKVAGTGLVFTDDAALYEYGGKKVRMVDGAAMSRKLTVQDDLLWVDAMKAEWEAQKR